MKTLMQFVAGLALVAFLGACGGGGGGGGGAKSNGGTPTTHAEGGGSNEAGGRDDHGHDHDDHDHDHEMDLGTTTIEGLGEVSGAQGHGMVVPGRESHLVIKLPYNDKGATVVRAWIGTDDPTESHVGLGEYAAAHDDYDIHADAPDPLPDGAAWWFEIEKPDGEFYIGTLPILTE